MQTPRVWGIMFGGLAEGGSGGEGQRQGIALKKKPTPKKTTPKLLIFGKVKKMAFLVMVCHIKIAKKIIGDLRTKKIALVSFIFLYRGSVLVCRYDGEFLSGRVQGGHRWE